jgi:hypothetical protein
MLFVSSSASCEPGRHEPRRGSGIGTSSIVSGRPSSRKIFVEAALVVRQHGNLSKSWPSIFPTIHSDDMTVDEQHSACTN